MSSANTNTVPATRTGTSRDEPHLAAPDVNPSFIKGIFLGQVREDLVFPFPTMSAEESESLRMILDAFRDFAATHIDSAKIDHDGKFPDEVRHGLHDMGLMGLNIPEAYGGFGASAKVFNRIFGELGGTDPALTVYFGAHESIGCKGITLFGTDEQKTAWLPRCATGEIVAAFCLTEPGSGSDAQAMASTAELSEDGTHYILDGRKIWISNAGYAGMFTVFAKVPVTVDGKTKKRVTAFIVDAHSEGITLGQLEQKMGIKASDTRTVTFEKVKVPVGNVLGDVGQGFRIALEILNSGRLGLASGSSRGARRILTEAAKYATQREQFGRPIGSFEMIQRKFAQAAAEIYAADSAVMLTSEMMDRGGIDFSLETAACKVFASELAVHAASEAMQIAGGIGYSKEFPYERAMRDSRINMIFEGTNEILRALIALSGMEQPGERLKTLGSALKDPAHSMGEISSYIADRAKRTVQRAKFTKVHPALSKEARRVATLVQKLAFAVEVAVVQHGKHIIERQFIQERMADAAIGIYMCTAVLSRTTWEIERAGSVDAVKAEMDCAQLFLADRYRQVKRSIRRISRNQDDRMRAVAERVLESGDAAPIGPADRT
ncbi:MAG: acyl-CoA dehydrogenase family protein [Gemmatimonadaceae bacterium]